MPNVSFQAPTDYSAEAESIARRRQYAQLLQEQSMQPDGGTQSVGGWAIPNSPLSGLAKGLQAASSSYQQSKLDERQKELGTKYQTDLASTLARAQAAGTGTPAQSGSASPADELGGGPAMPDQAAVPGDRAKMAAILMQHPATQAMGLQQSMQDANVARMADAFGYGGQPAAPQGGVAPAPSGVAGSGNSAPVAQAANAGIPRNIAMGMLLSDPSGKSLAEATAKAYAKSIEPINAREGSTILNGQTMQPMFTAPKAGAQTQWQNGQPQVSAVPGAAQVAGQQARAVSAGTAEGSMPFSMQQMDVPVYLPGGDQIQVKMNAVQAHQYQTTGQLPPEIAASIPGLAQNAPPQTPQQSQPAPQQPQGNGATIANTVSPAEIARIQDPQERAQALAALQGGRTYNPNGGASGGPAITPQQPQPIPQQPVQGAQVPTNTVVGRPVIGRTQSQNEQVTQKRQEAGGKTADEAFAKDYVAFANGGSQDATKQLSQLQDVLTQLQDPKAKLTGPFLGSTPDAMLKFSKTGQNAIAMRERVEEVVQRSLRAVLGAQFTEKEGERLIARAYNPNLPEAENASRVQRLFTQLQQSLQAKQSAAQYFQQNNTLQGWQGKLPSMSDFDIGSTAPQRRSGDPTRTQIIPPEGMNANRLFSQADAILNGNR